MLAKLLAVALVVDLEAFDRRGQLEFDLFQSILFNSVVKDTP